MPLDAEDARAFEFDERWVRWSRYLFGLALAGTFIAGASGRLITAIALGAVAITWHRMGTYLRVIELLQAELT